MRWLGPDALAVCRANRGLPVGFLLLRYSVWFTVESLSLLYLHVISWFICFRRWCIVKLRVFHANQISMCLDPHLNYGWGWRRYKAVLLLWIFYVFVLACVCYVFVRVCLYVLCGHLLGKGWPLGSRLLCLLWVCHFPIGILGQLWYLIVSIPDLCTLTYFHGRSPPPLWVCAPLISQNNALTSPNPWKLPRLPKSILPLLKRNKL